MSLNLDLAVQIATDLAADQLEGVSGPGMIADVTRDLTRDALACVTFTEIHPELTDDEGAPVYFAHGAHLMMAAGVAFEDAYRILARAYGLPLTVQ